MSAESDLLAEMLEKGSDPALDPLLWKDAGGNATLSTTSGTNVKVAVAVARLALPRPMCVAVQIGTPSQSSMHVSAQLQALIGWQVGRGTQQATVDIGLGTTFTLAAAQYVEVTAQLVGGSGAMSATIQCTMSPASAANPLPARFSDTRQTLNGGGGTAAGVVPPFASKFQPMITDDAAYGGVKVSFTPLSHVVTCMPNEWVWIPSNATAYTITNNSATNVSVIPFFELVL